MGCFPARNVLSTKPARTAEKLSGISPSLLCALTKRVHSRELRFPARLRRAGRWGRKVLCARHQGGFHLQASLPLTQAELRGVGIPPFPAQCPPAQVPGSRSAGLWLCTTQQAAGALAAESWGRSVQGAVARGSVACCASPNTQHTPGRGSQGLRPSRWGGCLPAEGTISPRPPPTPETELAGGSRSSRGHAEAEVAGWRGAAGTLAQPSPWELGAVGTGKGCWQKNNGAGFAFQEVEGRLAAGRGHDGPEGW